MILICLMFHSSIILFIYILYFIKIYKSINILLNVNIIFYLFKLIYYNYIDCRFNKNYFYLIDKDIEIINTFYINNYRLIGYEYKHIFYFKLDLFLLLENKDNQKIYKKNIEYIENIVLNKKYLNKTMLNLVYKYSNYFKKIDIYILYIIEEFINETI